MMQHHAIKGRVGKGQVITTYLQAKEVMRVETSFRTCLVERMNRKAHHALAQTLRHTRLFTNPENGFTVQPSQ